ncbi:hypothetical protein E0Z10_g2493 [Xylaria hypoxylon]|uniref:Uncharacterized protein n=1 Tax=Xylaria hypoxylon TaxID=37992 RepID=A0A4Z0ZC48_9PEZI|nr:hypothetical protein E0Z10_g2493 [Xylaria hypoxylon]
MLFDARKHVLCLAIATRIGHVYTQAGPVPVIGLTTGIDQATSKLPLRMNIDTLEQEGGPMWDLLIRGLDALQNKPEDDERSHFAVAGIHGMPYTPYNGVGPAPGGSGGGYCPHQSPQLISWHRAYLALYEQVLGEEVQRLALEYTNDDASAYREASQKLRLPYWDWASDPTLPSSSIQENITVNGPNGEIVLHNPLYNYRWQTYPLNATQFPGQGVASMAGSGSSFESPHNAIHNSVGGSFLSLDLTSFDSLLLAAMWAVSHNDTVQAQSFTSQGLYSTAQGEIITADSPLKPFYQADGRTFHTGRTVATIEAFGYTYPDILGEDQGRTKDVIAQINRLYGDIPAVDKSVVASAPRRDWFVDIQVNRGDLPLPCSINVYLGDQLAGRTLLLNMPKTGTAHDELPLSWALNRLDVKDNKSKDVERRLMNDLHVKVVKDGTTLDPRDIPSLHIKVVGEDVTPPTSESEFPSYSNRTTLTTVFEAASHIFPVGTYGLDYGVAV